MEIQIKNEVIAEIEKIVTEISLRQKGDFTFENRAIYVCTENSKMQPKTCAEKINELWNHNETSTSVLQIFKRCYLTPETKRERMIHKGYFIAKDIVTILSKSSVQNIDIEEIEKKLGTLEQQKRIVLNHIYRLVPKLQKSSSFYAMLKLNKDFAAECIDAIITYIKVEFSDVCGTEAYEKEIFRLEAELQRTNRLLIKLQDGFDEKIEEQRKQECENLILLLNSSKYGYILDLLNSLKFGMKKMRHTDKLLPIEISPLPSLVRQLLQFVSDCGITPIIEIGEELVIKQEDVKNYQYYGLPFGENDSEKTVIVISTGWEIKDKELVISLPMIQEKE